jgi:hypothetical protein
MPELLTIAQAQSILPLSRAWYAKARCRGTGPEYIKIGSRIFYPREALLRFAERHTVKPGEGGDQGEAA